MTTLRDMPMITIEQKNRFREAALKVEKERDEAKRMLATACEYLSRVSALVGGDEEEDPQTVVEMVEGVVIERDQLSDLLKAAGIDAKEIKAENARLRKERDRLKVELENRSHEPDMTASDAYHYCADLIEPHVVDMPHGTECNEQSLCRSVCGSLAYLITHWQEVRGLREERGQMAALAEDRRQFIVSGAELGYISPPWDKDDPAYRVFQECNLVPSFAAASHDARMKAEALEEMAESTPMKYDGPTWQELKVRAQKYRKQAEGEA